MRSYYAIRGKLSRGFESRTGIIEILPAVRDSILDNGSVKKESSSLFSSLISASIPFQQLISFLFWQFFLQPTNLSRLFFTLALTSKISSFFFFGHTIFVNGVLDYTSNNKVVRDEGAKEWKDEACHPCHLATFSLSSVYPCLSLFLVIFQCEIRNLSLLWRMTNQDTGNVHVAMEFYLAEHFRPLTPAHHRAPSFTSFNCIIAPLCELGGGPVKGQSR